MLEFIFASYWYWFVAACLLLILEIVVPGVFLIWLGLGAAATGFFLLLFPQAALAWQLLALIISISASVLLGLQWQRRLLKRNPPSLNQGLDGYIGRSAQASQNFQQGRGRIRLEDSSYPAICHGSAISSGQQVLVVAVENDVLVVQPQI